MPSSLFLWDHPVSSYAQKIRLALYTKHIPFEHATPAGAGSGNPSLLDPAFAATSSPRGEVPTLVVTHADHGNSGDLRNGSGDTTDKLAIFDSTIILEYLEDAFPEHQPVLRPATAAARARARMIEDICDTHYEAANWGIGEVRGFGRVQGEEAEQMLKTVGEQVGEIYRWLEAQLGEEAWFGGKEFGYADVCVWPFVNRSVGYGLGPAEGGVLARWLVRMGEREAVGTVKAEVEAGLKGMEAAKDALDRGLLRREYRDHRLEWMVKSGGINVVVEGLRKGTVRFSWP